MEMILAAYHFQTARRSTSLPPCSEYLTAVIFSIARFSLSTFTVTLSSQLQNVTTCHRRNRSTWRTYPDPSKSSSKGFPTVQILNSWQLCQEWNGRLF